MTHALAWTDLELLEQLGSGRSASVFRARLLRDSQGLDAGTYVAVKLYKRWLLEEGGFAERVIREVDAGRSIQHPNLLRTYGVVFNADGLPALIMELHGGGTTLETEQRRRHEREDPFDFTTATRYLSDIAGALATLHARDITHRDVKPSNVLLHNDRAILADLGVIRSSDFPEQTSTGAFLGTIRYAAPEYLFGQEYDQTIDVYSFGYIAYELYTNHPSIAPLHWAQAVINKYRSSGVGEFGHSCAAGYFSVMELGRRIGHREAHFVSTVLHHTMGERFHRRLSMVGFVQAVQEHIWRESFVLDGTHLRIGPVVFGDRFRTSAQAAEQVTASLQPDELQRLLAILREEDAGGSRELTSREDEIYQHLLSVGALRRQHFDSAEAPVEYVTHVAPSVWEAYTLGLFDAKCPPPA